MTYMPAAQDSSELAVRDDRGGGGPGGWETPHLWESLPPAVHEG
jgi:hypothetical protein